MSYMVYHAVVVASLVHFFPVDASCSLLCIEVVDDKHCNVIVAEGSTFFRKILLLPKRRRQPVQC